jgi:hypothetical protein
MDPQQILRFLEGQGYFKKAQAGDPRACGLFARLAAYELNPGGDPAGWGCLRKTGGGKNIEGYSEDAIVLGNDPANVTNVVDIIVGAGKAGASIGWGVWRPGTDPRRSSDVWEKPVPLTPEQMEYLKPGSQVEPPPVPVPVPVPTPQTCRYEPAVANAIYLGVKKIEDTATAAQVDELLAYVLEMRAEMYRLNANMADFVARMEQGFVVDGNARIIGKIGGTIRLPEQPKGE